MTEMNGVGVHVDEEDELEDLDVVEEVLVVDGVGVDEVVGRRLRDTGTNLGVVDVGV